MHCGRPSKSSTDRLARSDSRAPSPCQPRLLVAWCEWPLPDCWHGGLPTGYVGEHCRTLGQVSPLFLDRDEPVVSVEGSSTACATPMLLAQLAVPLPIFDLPLRVVRLGDA